MKSLFKVSELHHLMRKITRIDFISYNSTWTGRRSRLTLVPATLTFIIALVSLTNVIIIVEFCYVRKKTKRNISSIKNVLYKKLLEMFIESATWNCQFFHIFSVILPWLKNKTHNRACTNTNKYFLYILYYS